MDWSQLLASVRSGKTQPHSVHRSFFEQDFDRIIFSRPFRKLQDKTQVFPLPEDDFVHTRLTHSLEVSSVGRSLGKMAGSLLLSRYSELEKLDITSSDIGAIVGAAALAHDVGNPPFGHTGEEAISDFFRTGNGGRFRDQVNDKEWADLTNFEGNAQGYRILTRRSIRLSDPVLGAFMKYPRPSTLGNVDNNRQSQKKFGFFQSEIGNMQELVSSVGLRALPNGARCRHPLAFLVEAADDICYHIIDLEDGCTLDLIEEREVLKLLMPILGGDFDAKKYNSITSNRERIGTLRAMAISKLIEETSSVFEANEDTILAGEFDSALMDHVDSKPYLERIIDISIDKLYRSKAVTEIEVAGFEVLNGLLDLFSSAMTAQFKSSEVSARNATILRLIPEEHLLPRAEMSTYLVLRNCIDFVSGMTDSFAISTFKKIRGISLFPK